MVEEVYFYLLFANKMRIFILVSFVCGTAVNDMHYLLSFSRDYFVGSVLLAKVSAGTPFHLTSPP